MTEHPRDSLRAALDSDPELKARFLEAKDDTALAALLAQAGVELPAGEADLSDSELESVSGGYTFPATDWIYCDNPWTNYWCTLRCA